MYFVCCTHHVLCATCGDAHGPKWLLSSVTFSPDIGFCVCVCVCVRTCVCACMRVCVYTIGHDVDIHFKRVLAAIFVVLWWCDHCLCEMYPSHLHVQTSVESADFFSSPLLYVKLVWIFSYQFCLFLTENKYLDFVSCCVEACVPCMLYLSPCSVWNVTVVLTKRHWAMYACRLISW